MTGQGGPGGGAAGRLQALRETGGRAARWGQRGSKGPWRGTPQPPLLLANHLQPHRCSVSRAASCFAANCRSIIWLSSLPAADAVGRSVPAVAAVASAHCPSNCSPNNCSPSNCSPSNCSPSNCSPSNCSPSNCRPSNCSPFLTHNLFAFHLQWTLWALCCRCRCFRPAKAEGLDAAETDARRANLQVGFRCCAAGGVCRPQRTCQPRRRRGLPASAHVFQRLNEVASCLAVLSDSIHPGPCQRPHHERCCATCRGGYGSNDTVL